MRFLKLLGFLSAFALVTTNVNAIPVYGDVDTLIAFDSVSPSNPGTEYDAFKAYLPGTISTFTEENGLTWSSTIYSGNEYFYIDFSSLSYTVDYFLVKTGNQLTLDCSDPAVIAASTTCTPDGYSHFLYENVDNLTYGLLDASIFNCSTCNVTFEVISHVRTTEGEPVDVPEPSVLAMLGLGILGFGFARKFQK